MKNIEVIVRCMAWLNTIVCSLPETPTTYLLVIPALEPQIACSFFILLFPFFTNVHKGGKISSLCRALCPTIVIRCSLSSDLPTAARRLSLYLQDRAKYK